MTFTYPSGGSQFIWPIPSGGGGGETLKTEYRSLSAPEAAAKQITLTQTPSAPLEVLCTPIGGPAQFYGADFTVSGAVLTWSGLGLDTIGLVAGDEIIITYTY